MQPNEFEDLDADIKEAFRMFTAVMDELTGGAFGKGERPQTAYERISEWDSLTPDQLSQLREFKGDAWVIGQASEIDRLREEVSVGR